MSASRGLAIVAMIWLVIGLTMGLLMRRRGHDFWIWLVLGSILGPLAIPMAIERARLHPIEYREPSPKGGAGRFDILAGIDGSPESVAAVKAALTLFANNCTSLTLAKVLDFDSGGLVTGAESQVEARRQLQKAAEDIGFRPVETRLLFGRADRALMEHADEAGIELVVVGARGHGMSESLFGSVTSRLVGGYHLPVFVGPQDDWVHVSRRSEAVEPTAVTE